VDSRHPAEAGRLRWRCRRGMKELDLLLVGWLDRHYPQASPAQVQAFEVVLEQQDPVLVAWLLRRERPAEPAVAEIVDAILAAGD